jgi:DNA polymerase III gamma/tau subunit
MSLAEKYRPTSWTDVVGQDKVVTRLLAIRDRGTLAGRAYWLSGQSGTGKTTIARLIAAEVADEYCTEELDAAALSVSDLVSLEREWGQYGFGTKTGRAYLINEAHALRKPAIRQLLVMLERIPAHVAIVFTTTNEGQKTMFEDYDDANPLLSRCLRFDLARRDLSTAFAERLRQVAQNEGMDGKPLSDYVRIIKEERNNLRAGFMRVESGEFLG